MVLELTKMVMAVKSSEQVVARMPAGNQTHERAKPNRPLFFWLRLCCYRLICLGLVSAASALVSVMMTMILLELPPLFFHRRK
jgi:hypothetical protein